MADTPSKKRFRNIIKTEPLWGKAGDALALLFPRSIRKELGIATHARFIFFFITTYLQSIVKLPRNHGKSTYVTFIYVMYCILTRRKKFILILSNSGNQAVKFLARVKFYLTSKKITYYYGDLSSGVAYTENESYDYVEEQGKQRSRIWNYKEVYIAPWGIRIVASSIGAANRGLLSIDDRPDLIIFDDVEDRKNTNTQELRQRLIETVYEELMPAGQVGCQFIVIGTICHFGSYLLKLPKSDNWFECPITRATDKIENIKKLNGLVPTDFPYKFDPKPEYFTQDTVGLDGKKYKKGDECPEVAVWQQQYNYQYFCGKYQEAFVIGIAPSFWQEHYNIPKTAESQVFKKFEYIQDIKFKKFFGESCLESTGTYLFPNGKNIVNVYSFLGGDLAVSEGTSADWRSFFKVFTDPFGNAYVFPAYRSKEPDPFVIGKWVLNEHKIHDFYSATFDGQHFQKWFGRIIKHLSNNDKDFKDVRIPRIYQQSRSEKKEEVIRATVAPFINGGTLFFCGSEEDFKNVTKELEELGWCDTDDDADGLTYGLSNVRFPSEINFDNVMPVGQETMQESWYDSIPADKRWMYA
ncbi:MAG: hypothetical protein ACXABD_20620 [Candidatus Thorarchaeota archaeon]|jgi:hypothetical protein